MLVTLLIANTKFANHNIDPEATFCSELHIDMLTLNSGLSEDTVTIVLPKPILAAASPLLYLVPSLPAKVFILNELDNEWVCTIRGYVKNTYYTDEDRVSFDISSEFSYLSTRNFTPGLFKQCQCQTYSPVCGLKVEDWCIDTEEVIIDCLTGRFVMALSSGGNSIEIGNNVFDTNSDTWCKAIKCVDDFIFSHVYLDGIYKTKIISVSADETDPNNVLLYGYLALNFTNEPYTARMRIIPFCDKTYGSCFTKFNNIGNFFGFPNTGYSYKIFDLFSEVEMEACGADLATIETDCIVDTHLFGIEYTTKEQTDGE